MSLVQALPRKSNDRSLSTVRAMTATQMPGALSTDPHGLWAIEARRRDIGVTVSRLLAAAGVDARVWERGLSGRTAPQPRTLIKLSRALDRLSSGERPSPPPALIAAFWRAAVLVFCHETGADPDVALAPDTGTSRPMDPAWMLAARARGLAFYLTHVELQVPHTALAEACGTSKQRVHKAARTVEDRRDDPAIDALLSRAAAAVTGTQR
ncbi:hypothetical protein [Ancylobacter sp. IITR112]|uniref:hypothetical protein n=1 Tax=Ancylobacter sp. IITR112 TaxID=3138073 RepID=UPI00352A09FA